MSKVNQKEAVYAAVLSVLAENEIPYETNMNVTDIFSREMRSQVNNILFQGFKAGSIELDREFTDTELKSYVSGLQSNWLRKDLRLNGGVKYVAKNPGSRQGSGDPAIKAMKALLSTLTDEADKIEVQAEINKRQSELKVTKTKPIDTTHIPEALKKFIK